MARIAFKARLSEFDRVISGELKRFDLVIVKSAFYLLSILFAVMIGSLCSGAFSSANCGTSKGMAKEGV